MESFSKIMEMPVLGNSSNVSVVAVFLEKTYNYEEAYSVLKDKETYKSLNDFSKMAIMQAVAVDIANELGIPYLNMFILLKDDRTGGIALEGNAVAISPSWLSDPALSISALAHEIRHIFQDNCYKKKYGNQSLFKIDSKSKISSEDYWNFPPEVDARKYAIDYATRKSLPIIDINELYKKKLRLYKLVTSIFNRKNKSDSFVNNLPQELNSTQNEFLSNLEKHLKIYEDEARELEIKSLVNTSDISGFTKR